MRLHSRSPPTRRPLRLPTVVVVVVRLSEPIQLLAVPPVPALRPPRASADDVPWVVPRPLALQEENHAAKAPPGPTVPLPAAQAVRATRLVDDVPALGPLIARRAPAPAAVADAVVPAQGEVASGSVPDPHRPPRLPRRSSRQAVVLAVRAPALTGPLLRPPPVPNRPTPLIAAARGSRRRYAHQILRRRPLRPPRAAMARPRPYRARGVGFLPVTPPVVRRVVFRLKLRRRGRLAATVGPEGEARAKAVLRSKVLKLAPAAGGAPRRRIHSVRAAFGPSPTRQLPLDAVPVRATAALTGIGLPPKVRQLVQAAGSASPRRVGAQSGLTAGSPCPTEAVVTNTAARPGARSLTLALLAPLQTTVGLLRLQARILLPRATEVVNVSPVEVV